MRIRRAEQRDLPEILEIWNHAILHSTANFRGEPYTEQELSAWFAQHGGPMRPVLVAEDEQTQGKIAAFGALSEFRANSGYWPTAEDSIYVHQDYRGQGLAEKLLTDLMALGKKDGLRCVVAMVTRYNHASICLHEKLGFSYIGTLENVGEKFGQPLSCSIWQKNL